ncbi:hypothetical protein LQ953_14940 [Sphingomonas sp. IC-56]|uniref:hypothetical protein n=1 Tax=Sphingomonas sp. IC-56 TaxID=2898529 RepID=UPI001E340CC3|nr:hypothetical protein [Sphingomonas sp. IC-56]MCD2325316.1 hypothetical protein [Sphingomonas sp. IC-56]
MNKGWIIAAAALALAGCNSVKKEQLPASGNQQALAEIGKKLNEDDKKLLAGYLMRREMAKAFGNQQLADGAKTVGEALEAQRKWVDGMSEDQRMVEELKADVEQKRKAVAEQISKAVTVAFIDAKFLPSSPQAGRFDSNELLTFAVANSGSKPIKALKGEAVFIDTFGDEYIRVPMQSEDAVAPGERKTIELSMEINEFMDEHKKIMQLDKAKRFRFEPEQIVYADGSTLRAPERVVS